MNLTEIKKKLFDKQDLSFEEASFVFDLIMNGKVGEIETASILIALKIKNETKDEKEDRPLLGLLIHHTAATAAAVVNQ